MAVDWKEKGMVSPAKDQMTCGACWAHSTTGALETLFAKENKLIW
jgi:C1A family cysteine protease